MATLITFASKHGATHGIAERIAQRLKLLGRAVDIQPIDADVDPMDYEAVVIGSAVYYGSWLKETTDYVRRHREALAGRPVWLFSDGPLGSEATEGTRQPKEIAEFQASIHPREHRGFAGAMDRSKLSFMERTVAKAVHAPDGDFRDWTEIDAWAASIAHQLPLAATAPIS
jgi:menaquinone-dependent protoporphyrinogen oxidase